MKKRPVARVVVNPVMSPVERESWREKCRRVTKPSWNGPVGTIVVIGRETYRIESRKWTPYGMYAVVRNVTNSHDGRGTELKRILNIRST
jgi:hypothetical protein